MIFLFLIKVVLEKILGLTTVNNNGLTMCPVTGFIAYPAGLVYCAIDMVLIIWHMYNFTFMITHVWP